MNFEEAFKVADAAIFARTGKHLTDAETVVLQGSWQDQSYDELAKASNYSARYLRQDVGPKLWRSLSEALGEEVSKTNFRSALERCAQQHLERVQILSEPVAIPPTADTNFVGREKAIADLELLVRQGARMILIQGEGGVGKTTLAHRYLDMQPCEVCLELWMAMEVRNLSPAESVVEEWLRRDFNEDPGREFGVNLERLRRILQSRRVCILIDNLEPALDRNGKFLDNHRPYLDLFRMLADPGGQSITLITSRERLGESGVGLQSYVLEGLDEPAWQKFFANRGIATETPALQALWKAHAGNAKAMQILIGVIQADYEGEIEAYWQDNHSDLLIERELSDLVASQFNRLQQLDPDAYELLCRLGCYRYQDIPSLPIEGLFCLLWDVPEAQRRRVIKSLQDRFLIEARKGKYWLHPVIQAEARARLQSSSDWAIVNQRAATFWTESVQRVETIEDAVRAFEAYYHYVNIEDFERAADVILKKRDSKLAGADRLGRSFYKLGLLRQMIAAINLLISHIYSEYYLGGLYSILGVLYRLSGNIHRAIECHEESARIAHICLESSFQMDEKKDVKSSLNSWQTGALLNIGLCKLELWELQEAAQVFERLKSLSKDLEYYRSSTDFYYSFLKSCLGLTEEARTFAERMFHELESLEKPRWITEYRLVFLGQTLYNLGDIEKARLTYEKAIFYAQATYHTQVKAKALCGLAQVHRHRQDFATALPKHAEAISLLDQIGAKCDLAEAYYQLGLTYLEMANLELAQEKFAIAIRIFEKIKAPKQVEKVKQSSRGLPH
ncbi:hypothetical protein BST81_13660 [Leptolyngbya sp. 'hensonii']|uniref:tetratricopeptide repeat protein n=1 Tax=Leptolyngbya sp. 'hensonii' TaxID=1922337 RepID=UPI00094F8053|nr:tetratricopeptide repeat protein [Leptolyngbya sp. 'hensonii']OLP18068.1 hypothetical protein BST81_13660 [Leptolyngbya sp. 'hensonii']